MKNHPLIAQGVVLLCGREEGIRTLDTLLTYTRFPGVRLQPLIHLSIKFRIDLRKNEDYTEIRPVSQAFAAEAV